MNPTPSAGAGGRIALSIILPALLAPLAVLLARAGGGALILPVLATLAVYPALAMLVLHERRGAAVTAVLLWTASLSAAIIACTLRDPHALEGVVLHGRAYREEMFDFIRTGSGTESDPSRFLPQHLLHLAVFCLLSAASGGLLGIALGAVLIGYMSFYVGCLAAAGGSPGTAFLLGWPPWAVLRVVAFVLLGIALSDPLLGVLRQRLRGRADRSGAVETAARSWRRWYLVAAVLLGADAGLKFLLAPGWAVLLRPCLGG